MLPPPWRPVGSPAESSSSEFPTCPLCEREASVPLLQLARLCGTRAMGHADGPAGPLRGGVQCISSCILWDKRGHGPAHGVKISQPLSSPGRGQWSWPCGGPRHGAGFSGTALKVVMSRVRQLGCGLRGGAWR